MREGRWKDVAESAVQWVEIDVLDGLVVEMVTVELATALGLADVDPVGGTVGGAGEAITVDERFEENGADVNGEDRPLELVLMIEGSSR